MITEEQLEQVAISWYQVTGWGYAHGPQRQVTTKTDLQEL